MSFGQTLPRSVLDHLLEGFQVISPEWVYLYVNPAAATQGRSTPEQLEGKKMWEAYPGIENSALFVHLKRVMETQHPAAIENHFTFPDGSRRWFELRLEPLPQGLCIHSIDIEDRKRAEGALRALNEQLEHRVAQRTLELETSNRDLESFCYSVSHDLRAPLRAVDGFSALLAEGSAARLDDDGRELLSRIRAAGHRMGRLIDALLRLARLGNGGVNRREVDVSALAQSVISELQSREPERVLTWVLAPGLKRWCDPELTRIVLENLLGNAWKFTAKTRSPRIEVAASPEKPGCIVVSDNGAGFDMSFASSLFRPFRRLHSDHDFPGIGIGLATVRRIVEKHGGFVEAHGEVGQGSAFTFSVQPRGSTDLVGSPESAREHHAAQAR